MNTFLNKVAFTIDDLFKKIKERAMKHRLTQYRNIHPTVNFGSNVQLIGPKDTFHIGERSYVNDAIISAGSESKVIIGTNCAIGYRVSIKAVTHDPDNPCPDDQGNVSTAEADIHIGNYCWIGDNVFIREGVTIGNNVTVGANSVVTKSFPDNVVIVGIPAEIISRKSFSRSK